MTTTPKGKRWKAPKHVEPEDVVTFSVRLPRVIAEALIFHSQVLRRTSRSQLVADILTCWVHVGTDWKSEMFRRLVTERTRLPDTPERYPGYLLSIGFAPAVRLDGQAVPASEIPSKEIYEY